MFATLPIRVGGWHACRMHHEVAWQSRRREDQPLERQSDSCPWAVRRPVVISGARISATRMLLLDIQCTWS
jgi:hypothetical protein